MDIKIFKDYYENDECIYNKDTLSLKEGVTILVGTNGSGKTTLLKQIKNHCMENEIPFYMYDNLKDGGSASADKAGFYGDMDFLMQYICSSEGENIKNNMARIASDIGRFSRKYSDKENIVILLDAIDSGLAIDNIIEIKKYLIETILEDYRNNHKDTHVHIVISANTYELTIGYPCLDVNELEYITFSSYEDYRRFILKSRARKYKRYGWDDDLLEADYLESE